MQYVSLPKVAKTLWANGHGKTLLAVAFGWSLSISVRMIYPALLPHLQTAYGFSLTSAGFLLTVLWLVYGFGQLPGGILTDRVGERTLLIASTLISAVTLMLVVTADSAVVLFGATGLFGFGTALYGVSRFTILADLYPNQVGTATGVTMAAGDIGNSILPPLAGALAVAIGWQYGFGFAIPLFLLVAIGLRTTLPTTNSASASAVDTLSFESLWYIFETLRRPSMIHATVMLVLGNSILQAFMGFYPTYLMNIKGLAPQFATGLFGLFFALGGVIKPLSGNAYDRIGVRNSLLVVMGTAGVALAAIPFVTEFWLLVAVTIPVSSLLGYETVIISDLTNQLPDDMRGTGLGSLRTIYLMIGATSPVLFGAVADRGYFDKAFFGLAIAAGVMLCVVAWMPVD